MDNGQVPHHVAKVLSPKTQSFRGLSINSVARTDVFPTKNIVIFGWFQVPPCAHACRYSKGQSLMMFVSKHGLETDLS